MRYQYLKARGALNEADASLAAGPHAANEPLEQRQVPAAVVELIPESVAREHQVMPLACEGETLTLAATRPDDIGLADKLSFIVNRKIRLVGASSETIRQLIERHYGQTETESVDSMLQEFTDTECDLALPEAPAAGGVVSLIKEIPPPRPARRPTFAQVTRPRAARHARREDGLDYTREVGGSG